MNVYLCDHTFNAGNQTACSWFVALQSAFPASFKSDKTIGSHTAEAHVAYSDPDAILFVHTHDERFWRDLVSRSDVKCRIVLVRQDGGQGRGGSDPERLHPCFWRPEDFQEPNLSRAREFVSQAAKGTREEIDWNLLQPPPEPILALSILCEAWSLAATGESGGQDDVLIHPPINKEEWFGVFGKPAPSLPAATEISKMMGGASNDALNLLKAVLSDRTEDIEGAIKKFQEKAKGAMQ